MNRRKRTDGITIFIGVFGLILGINLIVAAMCPDWTNRVGQDAASWLDSCFNGNVVFIESEDHAVIAAQGGVNIQKAKDNAKKAKSNVEGGGSVKTGSAGNAPAGSSDSSEMALPDVPADSADGKTKKKAKAAIDPEMLRKALIYFQNSLTDRDVIWEGQTEPVRPFVSKSFRDNPFDKVHQQDISGGLKLNPLPTPGWYPPPGQGPRIGTAEELETYLKTVTLKGIVQIKNKYFAVIKSGTRTFTRGIGEDYNDKIVITIADISSDQVLLADEFGNKGLVGFGYSRGFEAQLIDDVLYLSHFGGK